MQTHSNQSFINHYEVIHNLSMQLSYFGSYLDERTSSSDFNLRSTIKSSVPFSSEYDTFESFNTDYKKVMEMLRSDKIPPQDLVDKLIKTRNEIVYKVVHGIV